MQSNIKISQSMMNDVGSCCPSVFYHKYILKDYPDESDLIEDYTKNPLRRGNYFEQELIGSTAKGKVITLTAKEQKSVYTERILQHKQNFQEQISFYGLSELQYQKYLEANLLFKDNDKTYNITICGTIDIIAKTPEGKTIIIDLKNTADVNCEWGEYCWGRPEKMQLLQSIHYPLILMLNNFDKPIFQYWIYDLTPDCSFKTLQVDVSNESFEEYKTTLINFWIDLNFNIQNNEFNPIPNYSRCKECLMKCEKFAKFPELIIIKK